MIARRLYGMVRLASLLTAPVLLVIWAPAGLLGLSTADVIELVAAFGVALVLARVRAPSAHFERSSRPTPESDRVGLLMPLLLVVLVTHGWTWAAAIAIATQVVSPPVRRRISLPDRLLDASLRLPLLAAGALFAPFLRAAALAPPTISALAIFVTFSVAYALTGDLLILDPLLAARQGRSLLRVWRRHATDVGTIAAVVLEAAWAYTAARGTLAEGAQMGVLLLLPFIAVALLQARMARIRARLHRLTLSRAAIDAMLRAGDPLPQVRSLLESIDPRMTRETVEVSAFGRGGDRWTRLVKLGPAIPGALERLGARALLDVQVTGEDTRIDGGADGVVLAFAARDGEDGLRGALLVYRRPGAPELVSMREFERAAHELGPLLGEYGAISATHSAATIDTLTGLANRRGVMRALDDAMKHVRGGGRYAVLLIDVDHFKTVNDLLGHQTGDRALAQIGRIIAENIRGVDLAGRFGGEEFLVLLRDAQRERAMQVAERLRAAIEGSGLVYADGKPLTISAGVAYARAVDEATDVIERADRALYRAKNAGRNRVVESPLVAV